MKLKDFELFKQQYLKACKTKSTNPGTLELYAYILKHENVDSDWWGEGHGPNDIIQIFEGPFTDDDWELLHEDIHNWSTTQLELLTLSIVTGKGNYDNMELICTLERRAKLLSNLLSLGNEREPNEIYNAFTKNAEFLLEAKIKMPLLIEIANKVGYFKNK